MSFFGWGKEEHETSPADDTCHNLQDGLFQIASQACHILVQVSINICYLIKTINKVMKTIQIALFILKIKLLITKNKLNRFKF